MAPTRLTRQSQTHIKQNNLRVVLDQVIWNEPLSRADIVRLTHISKPTVSGLVNELLRRKIVAEIGAGKSKGGRKPILLCFEKSRKYLLAFEMGRVGYRIALSNLKGDIRHKKKGEFSLETSFSRRLMFMKDAIMQLLEEAKVGLDDILKIVYIAPGLYVEKGKALEWATNAQAQGPTEALNFFREVFHRDVLVQHSTKLSLLGERMLGKAQGYDTVVYIDFAYDLGCSIMVGGEIYFGQGNCAGEIGYFYSSLEEFRNSSIRPYELGCLENRISGKAIAERGRIAAEQGAVTIRELAGGEAHSVTARTVFDALRLGDPTANAILKESFGYFNMALCNLINLLAPQLVIFGGGFSGQAELLLQLVAEEIRDRVLMMPKIEVSELRNEASIIGGIHYLIATTDFLSEL